MVILAVIIAYFALLLLIAWITGSKGAHNDVFFLGGRRSPWYIVAIGMIGSSLSGVTFVSVPGWVRQTDMTYMQMVVGFFFGYAVIAEILLPLYYRLRLTSIYTYLQTRTGSKGYRTGALFFMLSKMGGAAARLYLVVLILQTYVFDAWNIPFEVTAVASVALVWLYTFRSGVRTIIWTDTLQAVCLVGMLALIIWQVKDILGMDMHTMFKSVADSPHFRLFEWNNWGSSQHFVKQFLSGVFITIVMTGLDQDMMQKNLSCRNLREAKRNMYTYGFAFTPINFMFLGLGILLIIAAGRMQIELPDAGDDILPMFCTSGLLGNLVPVFFTIGIIAAAFSSADSALTALTTSFCIDILGTENCDAARARRTRIRVHLVMAIVFALIILVFKAVNNRSVIDAIYKMASYTYGPLLGLFAFGLFTRRTADDRYTPYICIFAPIACFATEYLITVSTGYGFGYEILLLNGAITFAGLWLFSKRLLIKNEIDYDNKKCSFHSE